VSWQKLSALTWRMAKRLLGSGLTEAEYASFNRWILYGDKSTISQASPLSISLPNDALTISTESPRNQSETSFLSRKFTS
jgi:hypothetical protein